MKRSRDLASTSLCRTARERIAWCMVGTAVYQVGRTSSSQWKKRRALKPREQQTCAPAASEERTAAISPWMWNSGMMFRHTSPGTNWSALPMFRAEAVTLRWSSGTIFGREVDPEVCSTRATSSGSASPPLDGTAPLRCAGLSPKAPAPRGGSGTSSMSLMPSWRATSRDPEGRPSWMSSALAFKSTRLNMNSSAVRPGLSGAAVAPAAMETNAAAASGPFGTTMTTRSPRPMPSVFKSRIVAPTSSRSSRYVSDRAFSGAPIAVASSAPPRSRSAIVSICCTAKCPFLARCASAFYRRLFQWKKRPKIFMLYAGNSPRRCGLSGGLCRTGSS